MLRNNGGYTLDPVFNTVTVKKIQSTQTKFDIPLILNANVNINKPNVLSISKLKILSDDDSTSGFLVDVDTTNTGTLLIKRILNNEIVKEQVLFDSDFTNPNEILPISPLYTLPYDHDTAYYYLLENLNFVLCLQTTEENAEFHLPSLRMNGRDDNRFILLSNFGKTHIDLIFQDTLFLEMAQERVQLIWCKRNDVYTWVYVP